MKEGKLKEEKYHEDNIQQGGIKMKKVLISLLLALLMVSASFAIDSSMYTFYQSSTTSPWTAVSTGTPQAVSPFNVWTCQAETQTTTALSLKAVGNLVGTTYATNTPLATTTCDTDDVTDYDICLVHWDSKPVLNMRIDVTAHTGTSVDRVTCLGITE